MSLNVLFFCLAPRSFYRPIIFSRSEVFCEPKCDTQKEGEDFKTIRSPEGVFDIALIINQLPPSQKPDLLVVKADATRCSLPINLQILNCPKLLIVGDTHHLYAPIRNLLDYASQEKFNFIMSEHDRHHLHYFKEAGFEKAFWIPGFNVNPYKQQLSLNPKHQLVFVGQIGKFHPYRKSIIAQLKQLEFPLKHLQLPQEKAAEIYADSLINLNISLNGDLNLRVFEVLASGGFLLTDKLSNQSGLELLFENGKHLAVFKNELELRYQLNFFLNNPEAAKEIARKGQEEYWQNHTPQLNIKRVFDYIDGKNIDPIYKIENDKRSVYIRSKNLDELRDRICIYEYIQELHLKKPSIRMLCLPQVDPRIICDIVDLPRLDLALIWDENKGAYSSSKLFTLCEIFDQITLTSLSSASRERWDLIALTGAQLQSFGIDALLNMLNFQWLLITDGYSQLGKENQQALNDLFDRRGLIKNCDHPLVYRWQRKADWGNLLLLQQKFLEAVKAFERALQDCPWDVTALIELGKLCFKLNDIKKAESLLCRAVSLERRNLLAIEHLAQVLVALAQFEQASRIIEYLLFLKPNEASLSSLLENCYYQSGLEHKALEAYRQSRYLREGKIVSVNSLTKMNSTAKTGLKRILVINNLYPPQELGGYGRSICDFASTLQKRGHAIHVLTSNAPYLGSIRALELEINRSLLLFGTYEEGRKSMTDPTEISRIVWHNDRVIRNLIDRFSPDVCLIGNIDFLGAAIFTPFLENHIPVINHLGLPTLLYPVNETPQSPLYLLATASDYVKQKVLAQGYPSQDIVVIYPGALVENFQMCVPPNLDKLRIVYASLFITSKGPQTLIDALKIIHDRNIDFQCSLAGDYLDEGFVTLLKDFVIRQGMEDKVKFLGYLEREELINLYSTHNVLVFPSVGEEAFGISQVEGMAAGLTLITTGAGGAAEVIEPDVSGILIPPEDAVTLAETLIGLTEAHSRWERIAAAGQKRATEIFDIERSVDILEEKFEELLQLRENSEEFLQQKLLADLKQNLRLRNVNLAIFPDWSVPEESLGLELEQVLKAVVNHPDRDSITLLINTSNLSEEEADLAVSSIVMNIFMQDNGEDMTEPPEISLVGQLNEIEWKMLLTCLQARIVLENENQIAIAQTKLADIPRFSADDLINKRAVEIKPGNWMLQ
jgi:glycosyltransferase involved in cell wall biosynthesis